MAHEAGWFLPLPETESMAPPLAKTAMLQGLRTAALVYSV